MQRWNYNLPNVCTIALPEKDESIGLRKKRIQPGKLMPTDIGDGRFKIERIKITRECKAAV